MSCGRTFSGKDENVIVFSTTGRFVWFTDWMPLLGMTAADFQANLRNIVGTWEAKPAYQTAAVLPELPDAGTVISAGAYEGTAKFAHWRETLGITNKYWIRFGMACKNNSGFLLGSADVRLQVAPNQCVAMVGSGRWSINPAMLTTTDVNYLELGGWTPTSGLDKFMAGLVVMNNESNYLETQIVCRTAQDPRQPNAWVTCEAGYDTPAAGNSVRNTGALTAPAGANVSTNFLIQWGLAVRKKSGAAGNPRAEVHVAMVRSS
jgi:hypothetical protein